MAQLVNTQPLVREVPSSIPGINTFLFNFSPFCVALTSFKYP